MDANIQRRYFPSDCYIETGSIFGPLRAASSDEQISEIVATMNVEGKRILGDNFFLRFSQTVVSKDVARRVFIGGVR